MFIRIPKYAANPLRSYLAPRPTERLLRLSRRRCDFSSSSEPGNNITTKEKTTEEQPSSGGDKAWLTPSGRRRTRHQIDEQALGKPGNIIVLSGGRKKVRKLGKKSKPTKEELETLGNGKESSPDNDTDEKIEGIDRTSYITLLEELRSSYPLGEDLSREEWIKLQTKVEVSFTKEQLLNYMRYLTQFVTPETEEESATTAEKWVSEDRVQSTDEAAESGLRRSSRAKDANAIRKALHLKKDKIAEIILRDYWKYGLQGTRGNLDIELPSHIISFLVESDKYSLEELAYSHGTEIEPYTAQNFIRVSGSRGPCESVGEIVKAYASDIITREIEAPFLNRLLPEKGDPSREDVFRWIKKTHGVSLEYNSRKSTLLASCISGNEVILQNTVRDLELVSSSMAERFDDVPFCSYVPASEAGLLKPASWKRTQLMPIFERSKPWMRWSIPIASENFSKSSLPSLFSQHYAGRSSQILRFLRKDNTQSAGPDFEEKLTAKIGQCLFNTEREMDGKSYTAPQLGDLQVPRFFHKRISKAKGFLPYLSPFPGRNQETCFRFQMVPCQPHKAKLPIIEVEITLPLLNDHVTKLPLSDVIVKKVKAITTQKSIDYLFPETNHDIRFTYTVARDLLILPETETIEPMKKAILSILEAMDGDMGRVFSPSCQFPLPEAILRDIPSEERPTLDTSEEYGQNVILGNYWLPPLKKFSETNTRLYDFMGETLSHSFTWHGPWDSSKEDNLDLEMVIASSPLSHYPRNRGGENGKIEATLEKEFETFYRTACILAFSLSTHSSKEQRP